MWITPHPKPNTPEITEKFSLKVFPSTHSNCIGAEMTAGDIYFILSATRPEELTIFRVRIAQVYEDTVDITYNNGMLTVPKTRLYSLREIRESMEERWNVY